MPRPTPRPGSRVQDRREADQRRSDRYEWRAWYKTARWRSLRLRQLQAEPLCRFCLEHGDLTPATVCDHVEPHRGDEGKFWVGPFQSLCPRHHNRDKQRAEHGREVLTFGADGWPKDRD